MPTKTCVLGLFLACAAAQGAIIVRASLSGAAQDPPNDSPGSAFVEITFTPEKNDFVSWMTWENLTGNFTATQVHCCTETPLVGTAGPATILVEWPYGGQTTSGNIGSYADTTNLFFFDAAFFAANGGTTEGAEEALLKGFREGRAYQNILSSTYPAGEIRGFLLVPVPEPGRAGLIGVGLAVLACLRRRRNHRTALEITG